MNNVQGQLTTEVERLIHLLEPGLKKSGVAPAPVVSDLHAALDSMLTNRPATRAPLAAEFIAPQDQARLTNQQLAKVITERLTADMSSHEAAKLKVMHILQHS